MTTLSHSLLARVTQYATQFTDPEQAEELLSSSAPLYAAAPCSERGWQGLTESNVPARDLLRRPSWGELEDGRGGEEGVREGGEGRRDVRGGEEGVRGGEGRGGEERCE